MNSEERAIVAVETFGFIVLASNIKIKKAVGSKTTSLDSLRGDLPQPFVIIGDATRQEAQDQENLFAKLEGRSPRTLNDPFYYKLVTD